MVISKDIVKQPYRSSADYQTQMRGITEKAADDVMVRVQSEMVRPYTADSYAEMEYDMTPPAGFNDLEIPTVPDWIPPSPPIPGDYEPEPPPVSPFPTPIPWPVPTPESYRISTPIFSPSAGTYSSAQTITIACLTAGAEIYYTTDGTDPDKHSTRYQVPLTLSADTTLKARAYRGLGWDVYWEPSYIETGVYYITTVGWAAYFDNTKWAPNPYGVWDGVKWNTELVGSTHIIHINTIGSWTVGYKPTKIRVTHNGVAADTICQLYSYDGFPATAWTQPYASGQELIIALAGARVLGDLYVYNSVPAAFSVTNIEFYG